MTLKKGQYWKLKNGKVIEILHRNPVAYTRGYFNYRAGVIFNCYGYLGSEDLVRESSPEQDLITLIEEQEGCLVSRLEWIKRKIC